jgi:hypothetical protein
MISKLPEIAVEEASKIDNPPVAEEIDMTKIENAFEDGETIEENEDVVLEYVEDEQVSEDYTTCDEETVDEVVENTEESISEAVIDEPVVSEQSVDIPITKGFNINAGDIQFDGFEDIEISFGFREDRDGDLVAVYFGTLVAA